MTKRFQVMMTEMLSRSPWGKEIRFECMHPGWADTPAVQSSIPGFHKATKRILRSPLEGADTVIYLAAARDLPSESGRFWFDRQPRDPYLLPRTRESHEVRRALWDFSFTSIGEPCPDFPETVIESLPIRGIVFGRTEVPSLDDDCFPALSHGLRGRTRCAPPEHLHQCV